MIRLAVKERGFRVRAMRCDSTVQEADIRHPSGDRASLPDRAVRARQRLALYVLLPLMVAVRCEDRAQEQRQRPRAATPPR